MSDVGAAVEKLTTAIRERYGSNGQVKLIQGFLVSYDSGTNEVEVTFGNSDTPVTIQNVGVPPAPDSPVWIANLGNGRMICVGAQVPDIEGGGSVNEWHYFEYDSDVESDSRPSYSLVQFIPLGGGTSAYVAQAYIAYEGAWHVNKETIAGVAEYRLHYWIVEIDLSNNWWSNFVNTGGGSTTPTSGAQMCLKFWDMAPFIGDALIAQNPGDIDDLDLQNSMGTAYFRGSNWMPVGIVAFNGLSSSRYPVYMDITNGLIDYFNPTTGAIVPLTWNGTGVQSGPLSLRLSFASHYLPEHDSDGGPVKAESTWHNI